jgi:hypothetical protein
MIMDSQPGSGFVKEDAAGAMTCHVLGRRFTSAGHPWVLSARLLTQRHAGMTLPLTLLLTPCDFPT